MLQIIRHSRLWFSFSGALVAAALIALVWPGLKLGIDFTGGTLIDVSFEQTVEKQALEEQLLLFAANQSVDLGQPYILRTSEGGYIIRIKEITNEIHIALKEAWEAQFGPYQETRFTTIGPTVGSTLKVRSIWAVLTAAFLMIVYIAFAFRNIPRKLNAWKFGVIAVIALVHDILITLGVFATVGAFTSFEVNTLFVSAILIILGYSVNDTIVIFDRVRENVLEQQRGEDFAAVAERGLSQSMARSVNTSLSTLFPLFTLFAFGPDSIRWFVLTLIVGLVVGTYSSIFLATPLLVVWRKKS